MGKLKPIARYTLPGAAYGAALGTTSGAVHGAASGVEAQQSIVRECMRGRGYRVLD